MAIASLHDHDGTRVLCFPIVATERRLFDDFVISLAEGVTLEVSKIMGGTVRFVAEGIGVSALAEVGAMLGLSPTSARSTSVTLPYAIETGSVATVEHELLAGMMAWDCGPPERGSRVSLLVDVAAKRVELHELAADGFERLFRRLTGIAVETPRQRAIRLHEANDVTGAIAAFREALGLDLDDSVAWYELAQLLITVGNPSSAVLGYTKVLELPPHGDFHVRALRGRVKCLETLGRLDEAIADLGVMITREPGELGDPYVWRGRVHALAGHGAEALADADVALAKGCGDPTDAHRVRADALDLLGRHDEAEAARQSAGPDDGQYSIFSGFGAKPPRR